MTSRSIKAALLGAALLTVPACSDADTTNGADTTGNVADRTLASALNEAENLEVISAVSNDAGLSGMFDGPASYTLLAPTDDAFDAMEEDRETLLGASQRPVLLAIIRNHLLPGYVTPQSIRDGIEQQGGPLELKAMGGAMLSFAMDGDQVVVSNNMGGSARLTEDFTEAQNGVLIPLDGIVMTTE